MKANLADLIDLDYLQDAWRVLDTDEQTRASAIITQVSAYLRLIARNNDCDLDTMMTDDLTGVVTETVKMVVANAVQRAMARPADMSPDATSWSQSASPYSESMSFSSGATQNAYFKKKELDLLGFSSVSGKNSISILRGMRGES